MECRFIYSSRPATLFKPSKTSLKDNRLEISDKSFSRESSKGRQNNIERLASRARLPWAWRECALLSWMRVFCSSARILLLLSHGSQKATSDKRPLLTSIHKTTLPNNCPCHTPKSLKILYELARGGPSKCSFVFCYIFNTLSKKRVAGRVPHDSREPAENEGRNQSRLFKSCFEHSRFPSPPMS